MAGVWKQTTACPRRTPEKAKYPRGSRFVAVTDGDIRDTETVGLVSMVSLRAT
jgi:hypothetical protein